MSVLLNWEQNQPLLTWDPAFLIRIYPPLNPAYINTSPLATLDFDADTRLLLFGCTLQCLACRSSTND